MSPTCRILRYIRDATYHGILMQNHQNTRMELKVYGYSNSSCRGDQDNKKNTFGYLFMLGPTPISLSSKKHGIGDFVLM